MVLPCSPGKGTEGLATGSKLFECLKWPMPLADRPQDLALMLVTGSKAIWLESERLVEGLGLGLRPWLGLKLGPRLGSVMGLGVGEEQQMTGQGWLEHRSKVRMAGPGAELVRLVVTSSKEGCVPGSPVVTGDCRS